MDHIQVVISPREKDIGGLIVRRILPYEHCMIGPFIFFDHMGPAVFHDSGIDVRPHPHINLATVTYLFEGKIRHRDSLGSDQLIEPGAINWMVAGHGIVHSERTPVELREGDSPLNGIQCWLALPDEFEEIEPSFTHHPSADLPEFEVNGVQLKLLLGSALGRQSPVKIYSDLFYVDARFSQGQSLQFTNQDREIAAYVVSGKVKIEGEEVSHCQMAVGERGQDLNIEALEDARLMFLGGEPLGQRYIYWNFVSSSQEKIKKALEQWAPGPGEAGSRFPKIPGDSNEFIPLPSEEPHLNPKGTIM